MKSKRFSINHNVTAHKEKSKTLFLDTGDYNFSL